jgi:hypothetical protein
MPKQTTFRNLTTDRARIGTGDLLIYAVYPNIGQGHCLHMYENTRLGFPSYVIVASEQEARQIAEIYELEPVRLSVYMDTTYGT